MFLCFFIANCFPATASENRNPHVHFIENFITNNKRSGRHRYKYLLWFGDVNINIRYLED